MASYKANALNPNRCYYNNGTFAKVYGWHEQAPGMGSTGSVTFTRANEQTLAVSFSGTIGNKIVTDGGWYEYNLTARLYVNGVQAKDSAGNDYRWYVNTGGSNANNKSVNISGTINVGANANVTIRYFCWAGGSEGDCTSPDYKTDSEVVFEMPANALPYNPYTAPSTYSINVTPNMGRVDYTNYNYDYTISGGTGIIDWVQLKVYSSSTTWNYGKYPASLNGKELLSRRISNNTGRAGASGSGSFQLNTNTFKDGSSYRVAIHFSDSNYEWISGDDKVVYTYTKPDVSVNIKDLFSPQDEPTFSWTVRNKALGQEDNFKTTVTINDKQVSVSGNSLKVTNSILNQCFSTSERSVSQMSGTLKVVSENTSAADGNNKYTDTESQSFKVQYQPTKMPTNGSVTNSGKTIIIQDTPTTTVSWSYPHTAGAAGVVNGYIVRVYSDSNYSTKVGSDKVVSVSSAGGSGYITLNNKTDLKRGRLNYATITPYYTKPNGSGRIEGTQKLGVTLVKPVSRIDTPVISYPTNGAQWHNKYFRVLLQLPADDDLSAIKSDYNLSSDSAYKYADVELTVKAGSQTLTYSHINSNTSGAFSTTNMYHRRKIAINPSYLSSLPNVSEYTISIRVKKKYYDLSESQSWSRTATIKISNVSVNRQNFIAGQTEITATQYSYVRNASVRLNKAYPFKNIDSRNVAQVIGDQIDALEYAGIYQTILDIQNGVNTYCDYDNTAIKLNQTINDFTLNPPKVEIITAADNVQDELKINFNGTEYNVAPLPNNAQHFVITGATKWNELNLMYLDDIYRPNSQYQVRRASDNSFKYTTTAGDTELIQFQYYRFNLNTKIWEFVGNANWTVGQSSPIYTTEDIYNMSDNNIYFDKNYEVQQSKIGRNYKNLLVDDMNKLY